MRLLAISSLIRFAIAQTVTFYSDDTCKTVLGSPLGWNSVGSICSEIPTGALGAIVTDCPPAPFCNSTSNPLHAINFKDSNDCYASMYVDWVSTCPCTSCGVTYGGDGLNECFNLTIPQADYRWGINKVYVGPTQQYYIPWCDGK
jgi:hypothetical protein